MKEDDKLSWGITLLFFGILFLLKIWGHAPETLAHYAFNIKNFPIVIGIIFLIFNDNRGIGISMITLGVFMRFDLVMKMTNNMSAYIWPGLLIIIGGILLYRRH
jgi:hypothetical protein